jgi:hypothetical protein
MGKGKKRERGEKGKGKNRERERIGKGKRRDAGGMVCVDILCMLDMAIEPSLPARERDDGSCR